MGGTASVFAGLSLGREGLSVQLGGMAAKTVARATKADKTTELRMISCGAGAGMAGFFFGYCKKSDNKYRPCV
ncbi:MAG: chloride channel protein [Clostridiales bacterium]|nr:chloride channel protein [Clostridiales bacterium]